MRTQKVRELHIILEDDEIEQANNFFVMLYDHSMQVGFLKQQLSDSDEQIVNKFILALAQAFDDDGNGMD